MSWEGFFYLPNLLDYWILDEFRSLCLHHPPTFFPTTTFNTREASDRATRTMRPHGFALFGAVQLDLRGGGGVRWEVASEPFPEVLFASLGLSKSMKWVLGIWLWAFGYQISPPLLQIPPTVHSPTRSHCWRHERTEATWLQTPVPTSFPKPCINIQMDTTHPQRLHLLGFPS